MALLRQASQEYKYDIDLAEVAKIWRAGCIIRAALLSDIRAAFSRNPGARQPDARRQLFEGAGIGTAGTARRRADGRGGRHSRSRARARRWRTTTRTAARACPRTSRRGSAISLAHTRTAASIATASFTPTGHTHEQPARYSGQGRSRLSVAGRARASPRLRHLSRFTRLRLCRFTSAAASSTRLPIFRIVSACGRLSRARWSTIRSAI